MRARHSILDVRSCRLTVLAAILLWLILGTGMASGEVPAEMFSGALEATASQTGLPAAELSIEASAEATLPMTGVTVYVFKVFHQVSDTLYDVALYEDGSEADAEALFQAEESARDALYGPVDAELHGQIMAAPGDLFEVAVTIVEPFVDPAILRPDPDSGIDEAALDLLIQQVDAEEDAQVQMAVGPVLNQLLALGFLDAENESFAPIVTVTLTGDFILNELSQWPEVLAVEAVQTAEPALEVQVPTVQSNVVHNMGLDGTGVRAAVIEVGGRINTLNPNLAGPRVFQNMAASGCLSAHTTGVAGIVGSSGTTNVTRRGHAFNVNMWIGGSCFGRTNQLRRRSTNAARWGARTFNLSFGSPAGLIGPLDRYYDRLVRNRWRTVVVAAGNSGATGAVWSPATAYNVVAVGSFDDRNTYPWTDDVMSSFSSGVDPTSWIGDREKPEVAAPGSNINSTTNAAPWTGAIGSGTSFAAPAVAGVSALLMQRSIPLRVWPESVKAIVMATAEHNIEGATRLSELDGAGGMVADRADDVARGRHGNWGGIFYNCSSPVWRTLTATMSLQAGERARAVMAWDTAPNYRRYRRRPSADLDLWVRNPGGTVVATSLSWDNTYEIVDFTATQTGNYTMQVRQWRCSASPRWLGWAYHVVE